MLLENIITFHKLVALNDIRYARLGKNIITGVLFYIV